MGSCNPKDVTDEVQRHVWVPDFAAWTSVLGELRSARARHPGCAPTSTRAPAKSRSQPRGELEVKLAEDVTARLSAGAYRRPPEFQTEILETSSRPSARSRTSSACSTSRARASRVQALDLLHRSLEADHAQHGRLARQQRPRHDERRRAARDAIAAGRGSAGCSYSYSHSTRVDHPGERERLFTYDQPHSINAAVSWKGGRWQLGGRFQLYSGLPYTPVIGSVFDSDREPLHPALRPGELRARADAPPARPPRRLQLEVGTERDDGVPRRAERLHERQRSSRTSTATTTRSGPRSSRCRSCRRSACEACFEGGACSSCSSQRCADDIDPPWQLDHDRIIAVRADAARHPAGRDSRDRCARSAHKARRPSRARAARSSRRRASPTRSRSRRHVDGHRPDRGPDRRRAHRARARGRAPVPLNRRRRAWRRSRASSRSPRPRRCGSASRR